MLSETIFNKQVSTLVTDAYIHALIVSIFLAGIFFKQVYKGILENAEERKNGIPEQRNNF